MNKFDYEVNSVNGVNFTVPIIYCPRCDTRNYIEKGQKHAKCIKCNARFNIINNDMEEQF